MNYDANTIDANAIEFEIEKLKSWKVYYINMYKKTDRKVYYHGLRKVMFRFRSMKSKIILSHVENKISRETFDGFRPLLNQMEDEVEEIKKYLKDEFIMMGNNKIYKELLKT